MLISVYFLRRNLRLPSYQPLRQHFAQRTEELIALVSGVSVRTKILGMVLALTVSLGLGVTLQVRSVMAETLLAELDNRGHSVVRDLALRSPAIITIGDQAALLALLTETVANHPDARYAFILNAQGRVLAHTFPGAVPPALLALQPPSLDQAAHIHYENYEGEIHDFSIPIQAGNLGAVRLGLAESRLWGQIDAVTRRMLLTTLIVALVGILAAILLTWLLTRPIWDLVVTTKRVSRGDLSARAPHWTDDEIGELADAFNQMIIALQVSQQAIAEKEIARTRLLAQLIEVQEDERKRIARELHDDVGQTLTSMLVQLKLLGQNDDQAARPAKITALRQLVDETLTNVRLLSRQLRPSALDDLGLAAALDRYTIELTSRYPTLTVDLHTKLPVRLPPAIETTLYRILQEAMTNAARHSNANQLSVVTTVRDGRVQAIIEDNGAGFDVAATQRAGSSVGLHSMIERAELAEGKLDIESSPEGTTIYVEIPVRGRDS